MAHFFQMHDPLRMSEDPFISGLRRIFEANPALKPATVSAAANLDKSTIRQMFEGRTKSPRVATCIAIAKALGTTAEEVISGTASTNFGIAVSGRVGAGAEVLLNDGHAQGEELYRIAAPPQIGARPVAAVEVLGDSMEPVFFEGDVLLFDRQTIGVPTEAIGRPCICEDADGMVWVKQVKIGTAAGLFNLLSINPTGNNRHDVALKWAAPVIFHLPQAFVKTI